MNPTVMQIIAQGAGALGVAAAVLAFQCKRHKPLMALRTANELLFALQYGLLGAATGMAMNLLGCVRNVIFVRLVAREKRTTAARIVFSGLFLLFTALTWAGPKSILSGAAKVLSTVAYGSANLRLLRGLILVTSSSWFVYNALVGSWAGCVCEALTIGSILVAFFRDFLQNKQHCNEEAHS